MSNLIRKVSGKRSKISYIKRQVTRLNSNHMELFSGISGSGKTWCAISDAYRIDPEFDVSRQLVFDPESLMKLINSEWFKKKKWKIVIYDEPQITMNSRTWQSKGNKMMNYLVSTFRHQNIVLYFCCPYRDFLDSASMKMIHMITEMVSINRKTKKVKTKPRIQQYNSKNKKTYEHCVFPYVKTEHGRRITKLIYDNISKPPQYMIDIYEKMKTDFTSKLNLDIQKGFENKDKEATSPDEPSEFEGKGRLTMKQLDVLNLWKEGIFDNKIIAEQLGVGYSNVHRRQQSMRKKGFLAEQYIQNAKKHKENTQTSQPAPNLTSIGTDFNDNLPQTATIDKRSVV